MRIIYGFIYLLVIMILPWSSAIACGADKAGLILTLKYKSLESKIPEAQTIELNKIAEELKSNKKVRVSVNTYTYDSKLNLRKLRIIGLERAMAIRAFFLRRKVDMYRISVHVMDPGDVKTNIAEICKVEK